MGAWEDGFAAGYRSGYENALKTDFSPMKAMKTAKRSSSTPVWTRKPKRKASAYSKRYGAAFKRIAPKNKKKNGGWKQGGFARTQKAAHKVAKK